MLFRSASLSINLLLSFIAYYFLKLEIQLYSLAGLTISLSLVIDNIIVMTEHVIHKNDRKVILSIIAATLTSIAALGSIFFMDESMMLNLRDFAIVIVVNLMVSVIVALFLVPALIERLNIKSKTGKLDIKIKRITVYANRGYLNSVLCLRRYRWIVITCLILIFGLPTFLMPNKIEGDGYGAKIFNATVGSRYYQENLKKHVNIALGGTWRLFAEKVGQSYYRDSDRETILTANITIDRKSVV